MWLASVLLKVQRRNKGKYGDSALRLRSGQKDEQKQATAWNKNKQRRNAGVPPLRRHSAPPPVGMTAHGGLRQKDEFEFDLYLNSTKWSITTMPTIFLGEVVDGVGVSGIFRCRGA